MRYILVKSLQSNAPPISLWVVLMSICLGMASFFPLANIENNLVDLALTDVEKIESIDLEIDDDLSSGTISRMVIAGLALARHGVFKWNFPATCPVPILPPPKRA